MLDRRLWQFVLTPLLCFAFFVWTVQYVEADRSSRMFAENGFVELGTALCFIIAGAIALRLCVSRSQEVPKPYRVFFALFAAAAWFVALEELSYGQHLVGWRGPEFIIQRSSKQEINLHNLYGDGLSDLLRQVANIAFPLAYAVIPALVWRNGAKWSRTTWAFHLLPEYELITIILVAQAISPLDRLSKLTVGINMMVRPGEVQELWWSIAAAVHMWVVHQRIAKNVQSQCVLPLRPLPILRLEVRRAA